MNKYFKLLEGITSDETKSSTFKENDRVMIIDGLNLFLRNFAVINFVNQTGNHIGGLGGFLRSLGSLIYTIKPTSIYIVFDGKGSSDARKNLLPEYKSGRNISRITNWDTFKDISDENNAKMSQVIRLIGYLKCLPIKVTSIDKVEADDIIAHLSVTLAKKHNSKVFIVSEDQDYTQLINENIVTYRPRRKIFFTPSKVLEEYKVLVDNFLVYKTLMGDSSDKVSKIKGLGPGKLEKYFPELSQKVITLQEIVELSEEKHKEHVIYARVAYALKNLENNLIIMDLKNPLLSDEEKEFIEALIEEPKETLKAKEFLVLYKEDGLGNMIKNPTMWLRDNFNIMNSIKNK